MNRVSVLLAQVDQKELGSYWQSSNVSKAGLGTLITAVSVVTLFILIWAIFIRKPGKDRPRRYDYPSRAKAESAPNSNSNGNGSSGHHSRRKRRRRRGHRPRKPTLSETGGLPPVRDDVPSDDPP